MRLTLSYSSKIWSASMDVDTERGSGSEQLVAYADYDMGSSLGGGPLVPGRTLGIGMYLSSSFVRIKKIVSGPNAGCYTYGVHKLTLHLSDKGQIESATTPPRCTAVTQLPDAANSQPRQRWHATDGSGAIFVNDVENGVGLSPFPNLSGTITFADGTRFGSSTNGALVDWDPENWGYNWGTATRLFAKSYGLYAQRTWWFETERIIDARAVGRGPNRNSRN